MITFEEKISVFPMNSNNHILTEDPDFPDYSIFLSMSPHSNNIDSIQAPPPSPLSITTTVTPMVIILSGSVTDASHVAKITKQLTYTNVNSIQFVASAHRNTRDLLDIIEKYDNDEQHKIIWVTVAGRSNALSGVVAANSKYPVIACPLFADKMDMLTNIHSTLQCPCGVPVMTILEPENVALAIKKMI